MRPRSTCGASAARAATWPGRSLRPVLAGEGALEPRPAVIEYDEDVPEGALCRSRVIVANRWKLGVFGGHEEGVLFDLRDDPHETTNRWRHPPCTGVRADLTRQLLDRLITTARFDTKRHCGA